MPSIKCQVTAGRRVLGSPSILLAALKPCCQRASVVSLEETMDYCSSWAGAKMMTEAKHHRIVDKVDEDVGGRGGRICVSPAILCRILSTVRDHLALRRKVQHNKSRAVPSHWFPPATRSSNGRCQCPQVCSIAVASEAPSCVEDENSCVPETHFHTLCQGVHGFAERTLLREDEYLQARVVATAEARVKQSRACGGGVAAILCPRMPATMLERYVVLSYSAVDGFFQRAIRER